MKPQRRVPNTILYTLKETNMKIKFIIQSVSQMWELRNSLPKFCNTLFINDL